MDFKALLFVALIVAICVGFGTAAFSPENQAKAEVTTLAAQKEKIETEADTRIREQQAARADEARAIQLQYERAKADIAATELAKIELAKKQATSQLEIDGLVAAAKYANEVQLADLATRHAGDMALVEQNNKQKLDLIEQQHQQALVDIQSNIETLRSQIEVTRANGLRDVLIAAAAGFSGSLAVLYIGRSLSVALGLYARNKARRMKLEPGELLVDGDLVLLPGHEEGSYISIRRSDLFDRLIEMMNARAMLKSGQQIQRGNSGWAQVHTGPDNHQAALADKQAQLVLAAVKEEQKTNRLVGIFGRKPADRPTNATDTLTKSAVSSLLESEPELLMIDDPDQRQHLERVLEGAR